jgi:hypothetical protein
MAFSYGWRGPNIVNSGLVLYLDGNSPNSFDRFSGTTAWRDISGNATQNNGTLVNGPAHSTDGSGSIIFDGSNDYVTLTSNIVNTVYSIDMWYKMGTNDASFGYFISSGANGLAINEGGSLSGQTFGTFYYFNGSTATNLANIPSTTAWNHIVVIISTSTNNIKIYGNGNTTPLSNTTVTSMSTTITNIGRYITGNGNFLKGNLASFKVYNRALTETEIVQNYNATKTRFGL